MGERRPGIGIPFVAQGSARRAYQLETWDRGHPGSNGRRSDFLEGMLDSVANKGDATGFGLWVRVGSTVGSVAASD